MYESPIHLMVANIHHQIMKQQDEEIYKAVLHYVPDVDKEELIRALQYDRNQYDKGYADGKRDAMDELVRCKDCKHFNKDMLFGNAYCDGRAVKPDDFCSRGER